MKKILACLLLVLPVFAIAQEKNKAEKPQFIYEEVDGDIEIRTVDKVFARNYNAGIAHYNKGVELIQQMNADAGTEQHIKQQDEVIKAFERSLLFLQQCYEIDDQHKNTLVALSGIYFALNEVEKSKELQAKIEALKE